MPHLTASSLLCALTLALTASASWAANIDGNWHIRTGADPLELRAGQDLAAAIKERFGVSLEVSPASKDAKGHAIVIGTAKDNPLVAAEHAHQAFRLNGDDPERYHLATRGGQLFAVGETPKGAMNAAFRFLDKNTLDVDGMDESKSPAFRYRVGGHLINQAPPPHWSEEDQARYYAQNYINVISGEKREPPLSYEARSKYGLGSMIELRFPPASKEWLKDPANADVVYFRKKNSKRLAVSPFGEKGRQLYLDGYRKILNDYPDLAILYGVFADYNNVPYENSIRVSDGAPHSHTQAEVILEILDIAKQALREAGREKDVLLAARLWHSFLDTPKVEAPFMKELAKQGYGLFQKEAGDNDCWIWKRDNFNAAALAVDENGKTIYGKNYIPYISAGGACESINPVIAMPLPAIAAYKMGRVAEVGAGGFVLWWASVEGWVYDANMQVIREMIWEPGVYNLSAKDPLNPENPEPLLRRIAVRDFGEELAPEVLAYWRAYDQALATDVPIYKDSGIPERADPTKGGLFINSWFQRMGIYTEESVFGGPVGVPVIPEKMADETRMKQMVRWGTRPNVLANYEAVLGHLLAAEGKLTHIIAKATGKPRQRLGDMLQWTKLYRLLLTSQFDQMRGMKVMLDLKDKPLDSQEVRQAMEPIVRDAIGHTDELILHVQTFPPNFNIRLPHRDILKNKGDRDKEATMLKGKRDAMKAWLTKS